MTILDGWDFLDEFIKLAIEKTITINIATSFINNKDR
jgi:hypothetical protein